MSTTRNTRSSSTEVWSAGVEIAPGSSEIATRIATKSVTALTATPMYLIRTFPYLASVTRALRLVRE